MHKRSMIANQQRNWGAFMLSDCWTIQFWGQRETWTVWTPAFRFGVFGQFLSSGQSLYVPAGAGSICPVTWFRPKCAIFELWGVNIPGKRIRLSSLPSCTFLLQQQSSAVLVFPVAVLDWWFYPPGAKGRGIPIVCLQSLCNWLWPICVVWKMFMPQ